MVLVLDEIDIANTEYLQLVLSEPGRRGHATVVRACAITTYGSAA